MIQIPAHLLRQYKTFIAHQGVSQREQQYYVKWMRFFLDFCHKYQSGSEANTSLSAFMEKLREKRQSEKQIKQAHHAIMLYSELVSRAKEKSTNSCPHEQNIQNHNLTLSKKKEICQENELLGGGAVQSHEYETAKEMLKSSGTDWTPVFSGLKDAIKIRHYSPSTLKTYTGWNRKFQTYTKSKDSHLLSVEDVKSFLTWLAVEQNVSDSSQNQAFNALLFMFRNVLGKEFGKVDGIVRAKRKQNIPVVLSRKEVDCVIALLKYPYGLIISLMYGCGLRISECISLRVHNFNFDMKILTIHDGKGKKAEPIK